MCSNDLFGRASQRAVGLIGRVRKRNSPFGRAQRDRTFTLTVRLETRSARIQTIPVERVVRFLSDSSLSGAPRPDGASPCQYADSSPRRQALKEG